MAARHDAGAVGAGAELHHFQLLRSELYPAGHQPPADALRLPHASARKPLVFGAVCDGRAAPSGVLCRAGAAEHGDRQGRALIPAVYSVSCANAAAAPALGRNPRHTGESRPQAPRRERALALRLVCFGVPAGPLRCVAQHHLRRDICSRFRAYHCLPEPAFKSAGRGRLRRDSRAGPRIQPGPDADDCRRDSRADDLRLPADQQIPHGLAAC